MKKLILLLLLVTVLTSFTNTRKENTAARYAFVTDTEHDKSLDEDDKNGYVNLVTNVVTVNCDISNNNIMHQFIAHYSAEEETKTRSRAFGSSVMPLVRIYNSYDEAVASRRDWLAERGSERKRTIKYFYVTCN
ncbi:hypothetical protein FBBAL38_11739 [Flavobacteria bacterium BAL38]|nr:hypothetical protein FBBAL38_11739 [Flavobacteria bacterium BAL38]